MALRDVKLNDKYDLGHRQVFVTGFQALVRLCLMQKELDRRNGLNTAGYVTGYRGSPLGGLDGQFQRAEAVPEQKRHPLSGRHQRGPRRDRRSGARNRRSCAAKASSMAYLPCGTARAPASTGPAMFSVMPIWPAPQRTAACWR